MMRFPVVILLSLALAGCAGVTQAPTQIPEEVQPFPPAVVAVIDQVAAAEAIGPETIEIIDYEMKEWSDSCLGLGGPAESCLAAITIGWRVVASVDGELRTFRTDELGVQVRQE